MAKVEGERLEWMEKLADVQDQLSDKDLQLSEVESQASEQMQSYQERVQALEAELESKTAAAGGEKAELRLTLTAALAHMRTGMLEVIEDYIHTPFTKTVLVLGNTFLAVGLWLVTVFALLKLAL